jgi:hypothetical protein
MVPAGQPTSVTSMNRRRFCLVCSPQGNDKMILNGCNDAGDDIRHCRDCAFCTAATSPPVTFESPCSCHDNAALAFSNACVASGWSLRYQTNVSTRRVGNKRQDVHELTSAQMCDLLRALSAENACSRAAKFGDCLSARWLIKVHHSLARYHGGAADMNKRCAMWLPTFLQRGIHFFGERTEVLAFNNLILFDRIHLPIIGKRAAVVEEKAALLSQSAVTLRRVALSALLTNYQSSIPSDPS